MRISIKQRQKLADKTWEAMNKAFPEAECTLDADLPERLAIRGILSAQCTDERVNITARELFELYPDMEAIRAAGEEKIGEIIRPCGLYRSKAKATVTFAELFCGKWGHEVPKDVNELMTCPGVGKKIANLIIGEIYAIPAVVVDTHCKRVMYRIGITDNHEPLKVEKDLCRFFPEQTWISLGHKAVMLGRTSCRAVKPACDSCPLGAFCLKRI